MKGTITAKALALVAVTLLAAPALTAPKPSVISTSWELDFKYDDPKVVAIQIPGEPAPRVFWFMHYTVTNQTGQDRVFVPQFTIATETGQVIEADKKVPSYIFEYLKKLLNIPLLKDATGMTGKLAQGQDNAKEGLAIWSDIDPAAGSMRIFIGSICGETAEIKLPAPITVTEMDTQGRPRQVVKEKIVLTKTLQLDYSVPGEAAARVSSPVKLLEKTYVMR